MPDGRKSMRRPRAFTLVELLSVLNIIMIVMGMAVPYVRTGLKAANESSAVSSLRTLSTAQELYRPRQNPPTYAANLLTLQTSGFLDGRTATGAKDGYRFVIAPGSAPDQDTYAYLASPNILRATGDRYFYVDESGVIRMDETKPADDTSIPLR